MSKLRIYLEIYGEYLVCWGRLMKNTIFDFQPAETGLHPHATDAANWRTYRRLIQLDIAYSSFVDHLNDSAARFCKTVLDDGIQYRASGMNLALQEQYARFWRYSSRIQ